MSPKPVPFSARTDADVLPTPATHDQSGGQPGQGLGQAAFPATRLRRNRKAAWARNLTAEHRLSAHDLIWPLFLIDGDNKRQPVSAMPGIERLSVDRAVQAAEQAASHDIPLIALFPATDPALKDAHGSEALNPGNLVCRAVRAIKKTVPQIGIMCDVALDPYTDHGHDGLLRDGRVLNDETIDILVRQALIQAEAGCDVIAPSDMMDGRVGAIRRALESSGFHDTQILAYAAKYASAFYGPFREAVGSLQVLQGDEALREVALDIAEGADMVMVKPGLAYLDVLYRIKEAFRVPTFAYQVSGEYSMIVAAAERGFLDRDSAMLESLVAFKRAGANGILTYFALDAARKLSSDR
jgi:porphobilinogen synthase